MRLMVIRRDGSTEILDLALPIAFSCPDIDGLKQWSMHDGTGTDYFFNRDDGTYDGWGRAVSSQAEGEALLTHARKTSGPPKDKLQ
jgi:hypothetical protein